MDNFVIQTPRIQNSPQKKDPGGKIYKQATIESLKVRGDPGVEKMQRTGMARRSGGALLWRTYEFLISVLPPHRAPDCSKFVSPIHYQFLDLCYTLLITLALWYVSLTGRIYPLKLFFFCKMFLSIKWNVQVPNMICVPCTNSVRLDDDTTPHSILTGTVSRGLHSHI